MRNTTRRIGLAVGALLFVSVATPVYAGGANASGPYDPPNIVAPSDNGNGQGNAYGKPAAGTVGNADTKNPPGQVNKFPLDDPENGYECDGNSGIAKGNPAHSFCEGPK